MSCHVEMHGHGHVLCDVELTVIAVSSDVLQQLELFSQYSAASYCASNIGSTGDKLTCEAGNCAIVQEAETTTLHEFEAYVLSPPLLMHSHVHAYARVEKPKQC